MMGSYAQLIADTRMQAAIAEMRELILSHFPETTFTVGEAEDPDGVYMRAVVDIDDTDEVTQIFIDRMIDLQVDEGLPLYVVPVRTPERVAAALEQAKRDRWRIALPG
jgi:hypothetical protein